ncbi:MAG: ribbon-helix-helix protein, CopG family [Verrucomicrobiales bacterium]|nr:ribbon-helix-helix protein, CopG family [Verrucomicrobiales bacterium]
MPTSNPRVNVTLSPKLDALVADLARHQRISKSQVLRELLDAAEPALQRAVILMDAASKAMPEVRAGLSRSLEGAQAEAEGILSGLLSELDTATVDLVDRAEAVKGRRPSRASGARKAGASVPSTPVPVTRGSGGGKTRTKGVRRG